MVFGEREHLLMEAALRHPAAALAVQVPFALLLWEYDGAAVDFLWRES